MPSWSASYDCSKASTQVEHLICNDDELSKLDEELAFNYAETMELGEYKSYLKNSQEFWLKNIRDVCTNSACLKEVYEQRINLPIWFASETPCSDEYDRHIDGYKFGALIKDFVRTKNATGFFVEGELDYGPRKRFVLSNQFDNLFEADWVEGILNDEDCGPMGWRGFMLSHGRVWYDQDDKNQWFVKSLNAIKEEKFIVPKGWYVNGSLLSQKCFSFDDYGFVGGKPEEIAKFFDISDVTDLSLNPGKYIGAEIAYDMGEKKELIVRVEDCLINSKTEIAENGTVTQYIPYDEDSEPLAHYYRLIRRYNSAPCQLLAPNIKSECLAAFLLIRGEDTGGSIGHLKTIGIYGLFDLDGLGLSIVSLKWTSRNEGLNFIDDTNF